MTENANTVYAVLRAQKRFEALRAFTLESGQAEIERINQRRKEILSAGQSPDSPTAATPTESTFSPTARTPTLTHIPEADGPFTIGDSDDSDDEATLAPTPSQSSTSGPTDSGTPSRSSSIDAAAVPLQLRGMSEKARGKMPAGQPSFSRQNSSTSLTSRTPVIHTPTTGFTPSPAWLDSWLPDLPLHTILTILSSPLTASLPPLGSPHTSTLAFLDLAAKTPPPPSIEPSPIRIHLFEWSPLSLGWYESLLWSFIFAAEMVPAGDAVGAVGVWNGTQIRLFRVQDGISTGPTLLQPKGAVDAVGRNLMGRIGSLNLRGMTGGGGGDGARNVREV
jgi:High-temperature-induced dauer-formation protein